ASVSFSKNGAWDPSAIETITFPKRAQVRGNAYSPELKERGSAEWKKAATIVKNAVKTALPLSEGTSADPVCAKHLKSLTELTIDFIEAYAAEKEKRGVIDFSDMGHLALRILARENEDGTIEPTDTAMEYRKIFREVMCDEYQDSNLVQEIILSAIAGKDPEVCSRFMVGDVKQSIYGFRQARPELFVEKYEEYGRNEGGNDQRIILSENFRSRRSVTNSVNRVFRYIMKKEMGGVEYDEDAELKQAASFPEADSPDNVTEILVADKGDEDMDSSEAESILIADTIEDLKKRLQIYDSKLEDMRPLKYGDIAILIRSFSHVGAIRETLEGRDIPVSVSTSSGYFSVIEVRNLMNFLTAIGNPLDDIALFGVMRGPLGGFRDEELAQMKAGSSEASFWETVLRYSEAGEDPLREKVSAFISMLNGYRASSVYTGVSDILRRIINETGYREMISSMRGGERRLANVQMLIKRAEEFEGTSYFGVHDFVRYIDEMRKYDIDFGEADTEGEESDAVRIMSIHKSKGLEFPVVFLAFSANKFNDMDTFGKVVVSSEYGAGMDHIDTEKRIFYPTIRKDMIVSRVKETMHGEEMRLLYTAMTRAKEKLIITGCMKEAEKNLNNAPGFTAAPGSAADTGDIESANNYLSWLMLTPVIKLAEAVMITKKDDEGDPDAYHATLRERRAMVMSYGEADKGIYDAAVKAFEYTYPHPELRGVFSKTTVTELKRQSLLEEGESAESLFEEKREEEMTFPVPLFMEGEERPAAGNIRGTAYHRVMAVIDPMASSVEEDILRLEREGLISPEQRRLVKTKDIEAFVQSELFGRMKEAYKKGKLKREQPFVSFAHGSDEAGIGKTNAIMQGMIDAMWEEDGGVVILDYKTDRVSTMAELEERYRFQLELYGEAIGREKKIKSLVLYSFHLDKVQEL
ncbi:MAG: UvrD-helicase domain-containing protein, partial [Lachnospiraceae bacterium]|nr:UvrD-helicase domain-containing protein [Lachnospiraceae bacterium]